MKATVLAAWILAAILLPAGGVLRASPANAARLAQAPPTCQNTQLSIHPQESQGAAGHIAVIYRLHNLSGRTCTLFGYPGVQLLNKHFLTLPTNLHRGAGNLVGRIPRQLVRLAPGGNAYFAIGYSDVPVNNRPCSTAYYLMIFPPNDFLPDVTYAFTGKGSIVTCSGGIYVSPATAQPRYQ